MGENFTTEIDNVITINSNSKVTITLGYKKLKEDAIEPTKGSAAAAGCDLYIPANAGDIEIKPFSTVMIGTGIAIELPDNTFGAVFARSGLATKQGLRPANCVGVVDSDYRGEVGVALHNDSEETKIIHGGDRIAQLIVIPYLDSTFVEVDELTDTDRGKDGFGSTGK